MLIIITPIIFGIANMDATSAAAPLDMFVSLMGIVMLTPVFQPEQNEEINDLVSSKYVSIAKIYLIRTIYSIIIVAIFISIFALYMSICKSEITLQLVIGTIANAIFLGSLGMITSAICNNTIIAYMIPLVFYALNYGTGPKLGNYYLFSMIRGNFEPKVWLLVTGIILIVASIIIKKLEKYFKINT